MLCGPAGRCKERARAGTGADDSFVSHGRAGIIGGPRSPVSIGLPWPGFGREVAVSDFNPYAAPETDAKASYSPNDREPGGIWRDGSILVMDKQARLPDRCVKCDEPTGGRLLRKLSWHHPSLYALAIIPIIYFIVYLCVRETARIDIGLCEDHRRGRRKAIVVAWGMSLSGIGVFICGIVIATPWLSQIGSTLFLIGFIYGIARAQVVSPERIDRRFARLKQVHPDFLARFPYWPTAP
jgi:hypothetical protein